MTLFGTWLLRQAPATPQGPRVYHEVNGRRAIAMRTLKVLLADHFVGIATVMKAGGYQKAAAIIKESLPVSKRTRSGDLAELLATEYVDAETLFRVPIRKLRWKSDREMPMHGNDVIAIDATGPTPRLLKGEVKSRANFSAAVAKEAADGLDRHGGRPNPSTLAFITKRLYEEGRDQEGDLFRDLQAGGKLKASITQLIFAVSGNDPFSVLAAAPAPTPPGTPRDCAGIRIVDHQQFIASVFA